MKIFPVSRYATSLCVAALLAGCGGSEPPISTPGVMPQSDVSELRENADSYSMLRSTSGDRLWTNNCAFRPFTGICIFSYPAGKYLGWIEDYADGVPDDMCAD